MSVIRILHSGNYPCAPEQIKSKEVFAVPSIRRFNSEVQVWRIEGREAPLRAVRGSIKVNAAALPKFTLSIGVPCGLK
jgi:hypothetical protein